MQHFTIPEDSCQGMDHECPFCYDGIHCHAYERQLSDADTYNGKPEWCKAISATIHEKGDNPCLPT